MSEEKRYYDCDNGGIAEFSSGTFYSRDGRTESAALPERYYRDGALIPAWIAEAAIAHWRMQREHPDAERKLRAWEAMEKNGWETEIIGDKRWTLRNAPWTGSHTRLLAAVEAAIAATEKKVEPPEQECWTWTGWVNAGPPDWMRGSNRNDCVGWDRQGCEACREQTRMEWDACHARKYNGSWQRQTLAEQEAELAEARKKHAQPIRVSVSPQHYIMQLVSDVRGKLDAIAKLAGGGE
jgi:hypothetical protein